MTKKLLLLTALLLLQKALSASVPDWSTQVAPILYNHCTSCHHDGGIAPFSLLTYEEATLYATNISTYVNGRIMPPWPPDPSYSHLAHERVLSTADIATITAWVSGGTPMGDTLLAPPKPVYGNTGMIAGTPDLIIQCPTFTSPASSSDVYQCFVIPSGLVADKYISSFEAIPGNPQCVHHVLVFADTTGVCAGLQAASIAAGTGPGYPEFGGTGSNSSSMLGVWVPGSMPMSYPAGFGLKIPHNADIIVQVHYPAGTVGMKDSTKIHFYFAPSAGIREVFMEPVLYHDFDMTNGPLMIPADTIKTFYEQFPAPGDMTLLGAFPHMHLIGQTIKSYGVLPTGDTDKYVSVNKWDFHWQGFYMFSKFKKAPAGTLLRAEATYNNTSSNPSNPYSPPQNIVVGENTTNEMMIVFFVYTSYLPGDENIIVDSTILASPNVQHTNYYNGQQLLDVCPNPAVSSMVVKCFMVDPDVGSIELVDMQGKVVRQYMTNTSLKEGYSAFTYSVDGVAPGTYTLVIRTSQQVLTKKVVVVH